MKKYLLALCSLSLFAACAAPSGDSEVYKKAEFLYNKTLPVYLSGNLSQAEKEFNALLKDYSFYTPAYIMLGKTYYFQNQPAKSRMAFQTSLKTGPNVISYIWLSKISLLEQDEKQAYSWLQKALQLDFSNPLTHYELAKYFRVKREYEKAIYHYSFAISYQGMYSDMRYDLASLYEELSLKDEAFLLYESLYKDPLTPPEMVVRIQAKLQEK